MSIGAMLCATFYYIIVVNAPIQVNDHFGIVFIEQRYLSNDARIPPEVAMNSERTRNRIFHLATFS